MAAFKDLLFHLFDHVPFFAYALLMVYGASFFYRRTSNFSFHDELTERENPAFAACLGGYLGGVAIALTGAFPDNSTSFGDGAISMTYSGLLAILLMRASIWMNHEFILNKFNIDFEMVQDRNIGAGIAVAGSSLGTGFVLAGALTGDSDGYLNAIRDIAVYWALGQGLFIVGSWAFFKTAGYDVQKTLEHDRNTAAGFSLGGFLVALGIVLGASLKGASSQLLPVVDPAGQLVLGELLTTAIVLAVCVPLLILTNVVTQRLIFHHVNLSKEIAIDKNAAAGIVCATASIATATLVASLITSR